MNAETLTAEKTLHWLKKTVKTVCNLKHKVSSMENYRANELAIRYDELKDRAKQLGIWSDYCAAIGASPEHNGYDLFA